MSFSFNKETRRSLRDRIRDGINLIPGTSNNSNLLSTNTDKITLQKKSHSVEEGAGAAAPCSPSYLSADEDPSRSGSVSSCSSSNSSPSKYRNYVVKPNDTITSIAASFDSTPNELMRVNRLINARVLFPGQNLKIPNNKKTAPVEEPSAVDESTSYAQRKFLKVKVRHVTDGNGVVNGTLLITPNAVMFDPNVSDPLVIEQGAETYGIIIPVDYIVAACIWSDICGMKVRGKETFIPPGPMPMLFKDNVNSSNNDINVWYFCLTIGKPKIFKRHYPFCVTYGQKNFVRPEFWFSVNQSQIGELYKYWMCWWPHLYGELDVNVTSERGYDMIDWDNLDVTNGGGGVRGGSVGGNEEQTMAQELNELTKESWEMLKQPYAKLSSFITTRGSSIMKSSSHSSQSSMTEHHGPSTSTGLFNSHHFNITNPMNSFFFDSFSNISPNQSVFDDTESDDDDDDEFHDSNSFDQVVTNEELRNLLMADEILNIHIPELIGGKSEILDDDDIKNLTRNLTARAEGYPWTLIFSSSRDGFSLNSLYRRNGQMPDDSPVILIIQDTTGHVFGALVSCSLHTSDSFYGTGQSFLFTLKPEFKTFKWTGENLFFVKGNHDGVWIGAGEGKFGLYMDGDLNCGRTECCLTYGNPPLTSPEDFIIKTVECWAFGNYVLDNKNSSE